MLELKEKKRQKAYFKKPKLTDKVGKYLIAKQTSKTKEEARDIARYSRNTHPQTIEATKSYQDLEKRFYSDELRQAITLKETANLQARNMRQERDLGASNVAIKMYKEVVEPETESPANDEVIVVFKGGKP